MLRSENNISLKVQVIVLSKDKSDTFVLQLKTNQERGLYWQNITGNIEKNEFPIDAARRELLEETGLNSKYLVDLKIEHSFLDRWDRNIIEQSFVVIVPHNEKVKLSPEHAEFKWVNSKEINQTSYKFQTNYESFLSALKYLEQCS